VTVEDLKAELDQLRADFNAAKQVVYAYIVSHKPPTGDPNDPALFVMPDGDRADPRTRDFFIRHAAEVVNHQEATDAEMAYWRVVWPDILARGVEFREPDYAWRKLLGMGATGNDRPLYGPYRRGLSMANC
jgi:hypothetical protein